MLVFCLAGLAVKLAVAGREVLRSAGPALLYRDDSSSTLSTCHTYLLS